MITNRNTRDIIVQDLANGCFYSAFTLESNLSPGDRIAMHGTLRPFDAARNPGAFSEMEYARRRGLCAAIDRPEIRLLGRAPIWTPMYWPARFRLWAADVIAQLFPPDEAAVFVGMLLGDHHTLTYEDANAFSATGTSHLLVTAGLHIGFFAGIIMLLLRFLTVERSLAALITIGTTWLACIISDAHIPSIRAAAMISTVLCARILGTEATPLRSLGYALGVTVALDPNSLLDASCYLSFSCVFAIMHLTDAIEQQCRSRGMPQALATALAITLAAQIGTWALIAADFHQISLVAPFANLIAVPLTLLTLALAPLLLFGAALHCGTLTLAAALPSRILLAALLGWVRTCAHMPFATLVVHAPAFWTLILYECALAALCVAGSAQAATYLLTCAYRLSTHRHASRLREACTSAALSTQKRRQYAAAVVCFASTCVFISAYSHTRVLRITMLDVGQGDGIVIETPNGHTLIIDTGGRLELHAENLLQSPAEIAAARVLLPFLQYEGITHVDLLLLTHPHGDHAGGAAPLLHALPVTAFLDSGQRYAGRAYQDAVQAAVLAHVPRLLARRGQIITFDDDVVLHILAPEQPFFHDGRNDVNENSIVAMLTYHGLRVLFTGDAGFQAEARLLAHNTDLRADILKVGHHGSAYATSSTFLAAVRPQIALISAGRHNLFHHPAPPTLERLQETGVHIYRTDLCGAISIENNGIATMLPCKSRLDK